MPPFSIFLLQYYARTTPPSDPSYAGVEVGQPNDLSSLRPRPQEIAHPWHSLERQGPEAGEIIVPRENKIWLAENVNVMTPNDHRLLSSPVSIVIIEASSSIWKKKM